MLSVLDGRSRRDTQSQSVVRLRGNLIHPLTQAINLSSTCGGKATDSFRYDIFCCVIDYSDLNRHQNPDREGHYTYYRHAIYEEKSWFCG
jgi:hypothetical protein